MSTFGGHSEGRAKKRLTIAWHVCRLYSTKSTYRTDIEIHIHMLSDAFIQSGMNRNSLLCGKHLSPGH